jgi:hypothetical protein
MLGKIDLAHPPDPSRRMIVYPAKVPPLINGMDEY